MTHKDAYPGLLFGDIPFRRVDSFLGKIASSVVEELTDLRAGSAGAEHRFRNVDRPLEASAHKYPWLVGHHGIDRIELAEIVRVELNAEFCRYLLGIGRRIQPD